MSTARTPDPLDALARLLLAEHSLESVMTTVAEIALQLVPACEHASVTGVVDRGPVTVAATGDLPLSLDERQYADERGPCLTAATTGEVVTVDDVRETDARWPAYAAAAGALGVLSSLSVPVPARSPLAAALNLYSTRVAAFDDESLRQAQRLAERAGTALANMHLYEAQAQLVDQLGEAMQSRAVIEQAKGIVMADRRIDADRAFTVLVDLSQRSNRKLREVAAALVSSATAR